MRDFDFVMRAIEKFINTEIELNEYKKTRDAFFPHLTASQKREIREYEEAFQMLAE